MSQWNVSVKLDDGDYVSEVVGIPAAIGCGDTIPESLRELAGCLEELADSEILSHKHIHILARQEESADETK